MAPAAGRAHRLHLRPGASHVAGSCQSVELGCFGRQSLRRGCETRAVGPDERQCSRLDAGLGPRTRGKPSRKRWSQLRELGGLGLHNRRIRSA